MSSPDCNRGMAIAAPKPRRVASRLAGVTAYTPPRAARPGELKLDANEGRPPPRFVYEWLAARGPELLCRYPDATRLERQIAARFNVDPDRVLVAAGADDLLERICRAYIEPGRNAVMTTPTFEMVGRYIGLAGGETRRIAWMAGPLPVDRYIASIDGDTAVAFIVSPNNPTGAAATRADHLRISDAAPSALLAVDLAYTEFADEDPTELLLTLPNALVVRTLSKAWGLAGLRIGYVIGPAEVVAVLRAAGHPYAVSTPALAIAEEWLATGGMRVAGYIQRVRAERLGLQQALREIGAEPLPSQANFVLARHPDAAGIAARMAGVGVRVRRFPRTPELADYLRITCPGAQDDFDRLARAIRAAAAPRALLLDLDGVIADVSKSYRRAIIDTAATFGVAITSEDICAAKLAGSANNDWVLTRDLLAANGIDAPLAEVTRRFERIYQGDGQTPGLRENESLLARPDLLAALAARLPLAIVTGRPRSDALAFLDRHRLSDLFAAVIAMEDGPGKPDPAPVLAALTRLGADAAWMVGDTVDDCAAARAAGVVPIAIPAPCDDPEQSATALRAAGAAHVLQSLGELLELLP